MTSMVTYMYYYYCITLFTQFFLSTLGLGDSSDSVTIIIISVTITTAIAKNYYHDNGLVVSGKCISPKHTHNYVKNNAKMVMNISDEINLDKGLQLFLLEGSKNDVQ